MPMGSKNFADIETVNDASVKLDLQRLGVERWGLSIEKREHVWGSLAIGIADSSGRESPGGRECGRRSRLECDVL